MSDYIRAILTILFGVAWVKLTSHRGQIRIRRIRYRGGEPFSEYMGFGIKPVGLLDGGKLSNGSYVTKWEPYDPYAPKKLPKWANT